MATTTTQKPQHVLRKVFEDLDQANQAVEDAAAEVGTAQQTADALAQLQQEAQFENKNAAARYDVLVAKRDELEPAEIARLQGELTRLSSDYSVITGDIQQLAADEQRENETKATLQEFAVAAQEWMAIAAGAVTVVSECGTMLESAKPGMASAAIIRNMKESIAGTQASLFAQIEAATTSYGRAQAALAGISFGSSPQQRLTELMAKQQENEAEQASIRTALATKQLTALDPALVQHFRDEHEAAKQLVAEAPKAVQQAQAAVAEKTKALALAQQQQQQAQQNFDGVEAQLIEAIDVGKPNAAGWAAATVHLAQKIPAPYKLSWDAGGADVKQVPQKDATGLTETVLIDTSMLPVGDTAITISIER